MQEDLGLTAAGCQELRNTDVIRNLTLYSLTAADCCDACNNQWLNDLERSLDNCLQPLARCERQVNDLSSKERHDLAVWCLAAL
ncbi:MAG: hypothetical protein ABL962_17095, partial [Fimbriimonadaceae bacterium]